MNGFKILTALTLLMACLVSRRDDYAAIVAQINNMQISWTAGFADEIDYNNDVELFVRLGALPPTSYDDVDIIPPSDDSNTDNSNNSNTNGGSSASSISTDGSDDQSATQKTEESHRGPRSLQSWYYYYYYNQYNTTANKTVTPVVNNPTNTAASTIPTSLDLRTKYPQCTSITTIRNQGICGSCWAFSTMNSLSDRYCISKSTTTNVAQRSFSVEDVMECCTSCSVPGQPCSGGTVNGPFNYAKSTGISTGENNGDNTQCKPYFLTSSTWTIPTFTCKKTCSNTSMNYASDLYKIAGVTSGKGVTQMIAELNKGGTIVGSFAVYQDFYNYRSGVYYKVTGSLIGYHAVRIIGYGTDAATGLNYWTIANTWGPSWGEKGYFRMRRGSDEGGIESSNYYAGVF